MFHEPMFTYVDFKCEHLQCFLTTFTLRKSLNSVKLVVDCINLVCLC